MTEDFEGAMMMDLDALFAEADALLAAVEPITVPVTLGRHTVGVRFLPLAPTEWRGLTAKHPPRGDVPADLVRGYNVDAVVTAFPNVALINEAGEVDDLMRIDDDKNAVYQWPGVFSRLTSKSQDAVVREVWAAHELTPEMVVEQAGKALKGSLRNKRS